MNDRLRGLGRGQRARRVIMIQEKLDLWVCAWLMILTVNNFFQNKINKRFGKDIKSHSWTKSQAGLQEEVVWRLPVIWTLHSHAECHDLQLFWRSFCRSFCLGVLYQSCFSSIASRLAWSRNAYSPYCVANKRAYHINGSLVYSSGQPYPGQTNLNILPARLIKGKKKRLKDFVVCRVIMKNRDEIWLLDIHWLDIRRKSLYFRKLL